MPNLTEKNEKMATTNIYKQKQENIATETNYRAHTFHSLSLLESLISNLEALWQKTYTLLETVFLNENRKKTWR